MPCLPSARGCPHVRGELSQAHLLPCPSPSSGWDLALHLSWSLGASGPAFLPAQGTVDPVLQVPGTERGM